MSNPMRRHTNIGHDASFGYVVEGVQFRRCSCGFALAAFPTGNVYWLPVRAAPKRLDSLSDLLSALAHRCGLGRHHPAPVVDVKPPEPQAAPAPAPPAPTIEPPPPSPLSPTLAKLQAQAKPVTLPTKGKPIVTRKRRIVKG